MIVGGINSLSQYKYGFSLLDLSNVKKGLVEYENIPDVNPGMYAALIVPIMISLIIPFVLCLASYREGMIMTNVYYYFIISSNKQ